MGDGVTAFGGTVAKKKDGIVIQRWKVRLMVDNICLDTPDLISVFIVKRGVNFHSSGVYHWAKKGIAGSRYLETLAMINDMISHGFE